MAISKLDVSGLSGAAQGLWDAIKTWDPTDRASNQSLGASTVSFLAAATPIIFVNPIIRDIANAIGLTSNITALNADLETYKKDLESGTVAQQNSDIIGIFADFSGVVSGVSTIAAVASTALGQVEADPLLLGTAAGAGVVSSIASAAKLQYDQAQNPETAAGIISNALQKIQTLLINGTSNAPPTFTTNTDGNIDFSFFNPQSQKNYSLQYFLNPNADEPVCTVTDPTGSGILITNNQTINYAAGILPTIAPFSDGNGNYNVTFTAPSDTKSSFVLAPTGVTATAGGTTVTNNLANTSVTVGSDGTIYFTSAPTAATQVNYTLNPNGTGAFVANLQTVQFIAGTDTNFSVGSNGTIYFSSAPISTPTTPNVTYTLAADGSGSLTANGQVLNYAAGATPTVTPATDGSGNVNVTFAATSEGSAVNVLLTTRGTVTTIGSAIVSSSLANSNVTVDASGNVTFTSSAGSDVFSNSGQLTSSVRNNADGSSVEKIFNADNTITNNYDAAGNITTSTTVYAAGGYSSTTYSGDSSTTWASQSNIYNGADILIGTTLINRDGTSVLSSIDPTTGKELLRTVYDNQGNPVAQVTAADITYNQLVSSLSDALATQLISSVLIKNNLPASIAAQAFTDASIKSALRLPGDTTTFSTDLAQSTFDIIGGIVGSKAGIALANALGIPTEAGSILIGTSATLVTQSVLNDVGTELGIITNAQAVLTVANFANGIAGAAGSYIGSKLANLVVPTNEEGSIAGSVASAGAVAAAVIEGILSANPFTAALEILSIALGSDFLGTLIGDFIGTFFGSGDRGVLLSGSVLGLVNGQEAVIAPFSDNGATPAYGVSLGNSVDGVVNSVLEAVGGQASSSFSWEVGSYGGRTFSKGPQAGFSFPNEYDSAENALANAVFTILQNTQITGGNPYIQIALQKTVSSVMATEGTYPILIAAIEVITLRPGVSIPGFPGQAPGYITDGSGVLTTLINNLNAAHAYSLYVAAPEAFNLALAMSGDPTQLAQWKSELATAQSLGLDRLSYDGTTLTINTSASLIASDFSTLSQMPGTNYTFVFTDTGANILADLSTLQAEATTGHLTSIVVTDSTPPTFAFSVAQVVSYHDALVLLKGPMVFNITDTAANVVANIQTLEYVAASTPITSVTLTDSSPQTFSLSAIQLLGDVGVLSKITSAYNLAITDTATNIDKAFVSLEAAEAAGHLLSVTSTDAGTSTLNLSVDQVTNQTATLSKFTQPYNIALVDTGANVAANLAEWQSMAASGKLVSVTLTDTTPADISVTLAQTTSLATILGMLAGQAVLNVTGVQPNVITTIPGTGFTIPLAVLDTVQGAGTNTYLSNLSGNLIAVTLTNSEAVVDGSGNTTFTTPLTGFSSSVLHVATNGTAVFTVGSDNLTFQANALQSVSYSNGLFNLGLTPSSSAYSETVNWNPLTGTANLVIVADGGQPVTTSLGQINPGTTFVATGSTITNSNSSGQLLFSTTVNTDGSQVNTVYNYGGSYNKDTVTTLNAAGQQTSIHWDHTDGSTYTTYKNPTTQAVIANFTVNADGSGLVSTANNQIVNFDAGNNASVSIGSAGDTLLTLTTLYGNGITETFDLSNGEIKTTINGIDPVYTLANAAVAIDASGNVVINGGGSTLTLPVNGTNATFVVGQDTLSLSQATLQSVSSVNGTYVFGITSPAVHFSQSLSWNPVTGLVNMIMTPDGGQATTTPLGLINPGGVLQITGSTITNTAADGTVISSTTVASDGSFINSFNNSTGALHVGADGTGTFAYGSDQLIFQPGALQSYTTANGVFTFDIISTSAAYSEYITWNPLTGFASLNVTPIGGQTVTTSLGQVNPGSVFSVSGSTITNKNATGQLLLSTAVHTDGSQVNTVYNLSGGFNTDTVTSLNAAGQETVIHWDHTDGSTYTSYINPISQAVIANFTANADGSGSVSTDNNQTVSFLAGNNATLSIGEAGDTLLTIKTLSGAGITETLDLSSGTMISTINGNTFTYTLANAGATIDASGNLTISGGGSTLLLPANGGNALFTFGQDSLSFPQNILHSLVPLNGSYLFGVTSVVTGYSESISWNPVNGFATLILTPNAGGQTLTSSLGQINPGNVLSIAGSDITITGSNGAAVSTISVNPDGSQLNIFYNNTATVNETVTDINAAGQITSIRYDNADGSTYTSYYTPGSQTIIANSLVNADGSGYVATASNYTVNFASGDEFGATIDPTGNPLVSSNPFASDGTAETLELAPSGITSTINGASLFYSLPSPAISYDGLGNLTLTASGSTLLLPANGTNYLFTVGQDVISLDPASVTSVTPNGSGYNFILKPQGSVSEVVTWNPQTGIATLNITSSSNQLTTTNLGYINPGYILKVSSSLITNTNASGLVLNSYALQTNGSVITTASGTAYNLSISNSLVGLSGNDTVTVIGSNNTIYAAQNDTVTLQGSGNTIEAAASGAAINGAGNSYTYKIVDTSANIMGNLAALTANVSNISAMTLTDVTTPTLALTATQYASDIATLGKIGGAYNLSISGVLAANASTIAAKPYVTSTAVSDLATNVLTNIVALETLALENKLSSIILTNTSTATLTLSATQYAADSAVLALIASPFNLIVQNVSAANAASVAAATHVTSVTIIDTGANVSANLATLQTLVASNKVTSIVLTDTTKPTFALTLVQYIADAGALAKITSPYNLTVSGATLAYANAVAYNTHVLSETVADASVLVGSYMNLLQSLVTSGKVSSISLTDKTTPTLTLALSQYGSDTAALGLITNPYYLSITGVTAANATTVAGQTNIKSVVISDSSANILANMAALQTLVTGSKIASIVLTDSTPPSLTLTGAQYAADAGVLAKITSAYSLTVSGALAVNAASVVANNHITLFTVSDTAANVVTNIAALETLAIGTKLSSITLTNLGTPTLALTAAQFSANTAVFSKISGTYNLAVSGVSAVNASSVVNNTRVTSLTVSDTHANVVTNLAALQTLVANNKLSSIILNDSTTPTLALTLAQYTPNTGALGKITSAYNLSVSGVTITWLGTVSNNTHVTSMTVSDLGIFVAGYMTTLETLATNGRLTSITLTDSTTPTLSLTAAQYAADTAALAKINSSYNLSITSVTAANASTMAAQAHVKLVTISDTAANVLANITGLETLATNAKLASIVLTDSSTPTLAITSAQYASYNAAFIKIASAYDLTVTSALAANALSVASNKHVTSLSVSDTAADVSLSIALLESLMTGTYGSKLASIILSDVSTPTLSLTYAQYTADTAVLSKISSAYSVAVSGVSVANASTIAANPLVTSINISDASSNVLANISALQSLGTKLSSIALLNVSAPTLSLTPAQFTADALVLSKITSPFTVSIVENGVTFSFANNALGSVSVNGSSVAFTMNSVALGYTETLTWTSGTKALLNLTNSSGQTFSSSLGVLASGEQVQVTSSLISVINASGQTVNTTQVNADGSQLDTSYDTLGGTWKDILYYYSNTGLNTEVRYDNNNGTFVDDFYNSSGTLTGQTIYNADGILHAANSNISAINTGGMTTLDVIGSSSVTASELSGFVSLTNSTGSADMVYATVAGTYSIAYQTVSGNFNLSAANTAASVNLIGNNQSGQVLTGGAGADTLTVGTGNDLMNGGTGTTAYSFGTAFGQDTINNAYSGNTAVKGEIDFASGITNENLWFQQSGNNLVVDLLGTTDQITVAGWFGSNAGAEVQTFNAGGLKLDSQISQLVSAMASYAASNPGFNPTLATAMPTNTALQNTVSASWHH